jgi:hypothetical protein
MRYLFILTHWIAMLLFANVIGAGISVITTDRVPNAFTAGAYIAFATNITVIAGGTVHHGAA